MAGGLPVVNRISRPGGTGTGICASAVPAVTPTSAARTALCTAFKLIEPPCVAFLQPELIEQGVCHARRFRSVGIWLRHRRAARPKSLDRAPDPFLAHAPGARASSPLGDFARRDPDCFRVGERSTFVTIYTLYPLR